MVNQYGLPMEQVGRWPVYDADVIIKFSKIVIIKHDKQNSRISRNIYEVSRDTEKYLKIHIQCVFLRKCTPLIVLSKVT